MDGDMGLAIAIVLLDAVVIALAIHLGRMKRQGMGPDAQSVRVFFLMLFALGIAFAAFQPLAAICLIVAYIVCGRPTFGFSAYP